MPRTKTINQKSQHQQNASDGLEISKKLCQFLLLYDTLICTAVVVSFFKLGTRSPVRDLSSGAVLV